MTLIEPGRIVLFYQQAQLRTGIISGVEGRGFRVTDQEGGEHLLSPDRFIHITEQSYLPADAGSLQEFIEGMRLCLEDMDTEGVLATLTDDEGTFSFEEATARLGMGEDRESFALFHFLRSRDDIFSFKKDKYRALTDRERLRQGEKKSAEEARKSYLLEVEFYIKGLRDKGRESSREFAASPTGRQFAAELRSLLATNAPKDISRLLRTIYDEEARPEKINELRLQLGDIRPDTDPWAAASGIPICFPSGMQHEILPAGELPEADRGAFTIDAGDSADLDDAITLKQTSAGWRLGIHISDVASRISATSKLYAQAKERTASLYLPPGAISLLPEELSCGELSLLSGQERPVLTLSIDLDRDMKITRHEFSRKKLRVERNLSYDDTDRQLQDDPRSPLLSICRGLQKDRTGSEADKKARYSWNLKACGEDITMQRTDNLSPARFVVEELMILYNRMLAETAAEAQLPLIYRNIAQFPDTDDEEAPTTGIQAYLSTRAQFHPGIGSQAYLHATSPIRRFTDIINQAQFEALLEGRKLPYSRADLETLIPSIEKRLLRLREIAHQSERYWLLRYLEKKHLSQPLDAILTRRTRQGYLAELLRWEKKIVLKCDDKPPLQVPVKVVVSSVDTSELTAWGDVII
jgi:exoribonuclease-2